MNLQRKKMRQFSTAIKPGAKDTVDWSTADPEAITKAMLEEQQGDDEDKPQFWANWTSSQKKDYNEWLFRKMRPIVRRGLYVALAAQGFQPADEKVPPDEVMTEHFIETLVAHSLIIPKSQKMSPFQTQVIPSLTHIKIVLMIYGLLWMHLKSSHVTA
eukprot:UN00945